MIRINLLGRERPKAARPPVPLEATLQVVFLVAALVLSIGLLYGHYWQMNKQDVALQDHIRRQMSEKARLEQLKQQVDTFEKQKALLQRRIGVIEDLQRNRTGGQELMEAIANTVSRTDTLWLTSVDRKGENLSVAGSAGSINAVANFITQMKRSGYFQDVEIKESHQDDTNRAIQIFQFTLTAQFALPQSGTATAPAPSPAAASTSGPKKGPAGKS